MKVDIAVGHLDRKIIDMIKKEKGVAYSLLVDFLKDDANAPYIWKRVDALKKAGIIRNEGGTYEIASDIIDNGEVIQVDVKKFLHTLKPIHFQILELLNGRDIYSKLAWISVKVNNNIHNTLYAVEQLKFIGLVRKVSRGFYEITPLGKKVLEYLGKENDGRNKTAGGK